VTRERFEDFALRLHPRDNVAVVRKPLRPGVELVNGDVRVTPTAAVGAGHKVALKAISRGAEVTKYGQTIGFATTDISTGEHVHTHNLGMRDFGRDYAFCADYRPVRHYADAHARTFNGYLRPDGRVGTRNYVAVVSSVNCSASVSNYVRDRFRTPQFRRDFPNVDGVIAFTFGAGAALAGAGAESAAGASPGSRFESHSGSESLISMLSAA